MVCSKPECTMSFSDAPWSRKFTISKSSIQVRWDVKVGPKLGQIGAKWDKCETSKISFQYILPLRAKMSWKLIFKSPRFVPFGANVSQLKDKHDTPVGCVTTYSQRWGCRETCNIYHSLHFLVHKLVSYCVRVALYPAYNGLLSQ